MGPRFGAKKPRIRPLGRFCTNFLGGNKIPGRPPRVCAFFCYLLIIIFFTFSFGVKKPGFRGATCTTAGESGDFSTGCPQKAPFSPQIPRLPAGVFCTDFPPPSRFAAPFWGEKSQNRVCAGRRKGPMQMSGMQMRRHANVQYANEPSQPVNEQYANEPVCK